MNIEIRRANTGDAALISTLSAVTFSDTFRGTCTDDDLEQFIDRYFVKEQVYKELQDPFDFYFIAVINNEPVGYLRMKEESTDVPAIKKYKAIELKRIYVLKKYQHMKAGAALMKFALGFAAEKNYEVVWLGVWEHNERAKSFYGKWGFEDTGFTHPFPIGSTPQTDQWYMKVIK
ncbi:MAG: GNAT family N-acetyltransferase [Ginsengibacter sp.]